MSARYGAYYCLAPLSYEVSASSSAVGTSTFEVVPQCSSAAVGTSSFTITEVHASFSSSARGISRFLPRTGAIASGRYRR